MLSPIEVEHFSMEGPLVGWDPGWDPRTWFPTGYIKSNMKIVAPEAAVGIAHRGEIYDNGTLDYGVKVNQSGNGYADVNYWSDKCCSCYSAHMVMNFNWYGKGNITKPAAGALATILVVEMANFEALKTFGVRAIEILEELGKSGLGKLPSI